MKTTSLKLALLSAFCFPLSAFSQGSLTPPGAPLPTMKTLAQVEPRTPISAAPFTITNSGSYYLTTNVTVGSGNAITISATGVTLDLNGFTIASTAPSAVGHGIWLSGGDITIVNGHIRSGVTNNGSGVYSGSGFSWGILGSGSTMANVVVSKVSVTGVLYDGIDLPNEKANVVEACTVTTAGGYGIYASTIKGSVATDCGGAIYGDQVTDCRGMSTGSGYGVYASATAQNCYGSTTSSMGVYAITAQNCYGSSSSGYGIFAGTAQNCYGSSGSSYGIYADNTAQNCYGSSNSDNGLYAHSAQNCYGNSSSGTGLAANTAVNCNGYSTSGTGLAANTALNCIGHANGSSPGLIADRANSCYGSSSSGTGLMATYGNFCFGSSVSVTTKYNMP